MSETRCRHIHLSGQQCPYPRSGRGRAYCGIHKDERWMADPRECKDCAAALQVFPIRKYDGVPF